LGSLITLVFVGSLEPSTVEGLGFIVTGKNAETDRGLGTHRDVCNAAGGSVTDIVEVRGSSPDNHSESDESVKVIGQGGAGHRQLEGSWHSDDGRVAYSGIDQPAQSTVE
jgi:hypothetical protein